jgi:hypothetical protein
MKKFVTLMFILNSLFVTSLIAKTIPAAVTSTALAVTATATAIVTETPPADATVQSISSTSAPATKYSIDIKTDYQEDSAGQVISNKLSLKAKQTLFDNFLAEAYIRFDKPMSNENLPVTTEVLTAKFQYVNNYFNITAGRAELTKTISTLNFFGPFCTAGQRYLDFVGFTIPFYLKAGIPELEEIDLPPLALSAYYFPTMFNFLHTSYDGSQEYYLFQVRANAEIAKCPSQLILNVGKSTSDYFNYSILSTNPAIDISLSTDLGNHFKIILSGGVLNTSLFNDTSVIAGGIELHNFKGWIFAFDEIIFETQMPFIQGAAAGFDPQKFPWFISVRNKIGKFRYGLAATTSNNDYTFNSLVSYNPNFVPPFGSGNVYAPEGIQFNGANPGGAPCWYGYVGYEY